MQRSSRSKRRSRKRQRKLILTDWPRRNKLRREAVSCPSNENKTSWMQAKEEEQSLCRCISSRKFTWRHLEEALLQTRLISKSFPKIIKVWWLRLRIIIISQSAKWVDSIQFPKIAEKVEILTKTFMQHEKRCNRASRPRCCNNLKIKCMLLIQ